MTTLAPGPRRRSPFAAWFPLLAVCLAAWALAFTSGAHLLHFDAKAHLLVARRVVDSLTPGWTQLGAVWLPLPHLLNVLPAQSDALYYSGAFASVLGLVTFGTGVILLGRAAARATGDPRAGLVAVAVPALNPGWLYLQATPMTEPLFLGLVGGLTFFVIRWRETRSPGDLYGATACAAAAALVRYEAWPIVAAAVVAASWRLPGLPLREAGRRVVPVLLGLGLVVPVLLFGLHSWIATERAFYVIDSGNLTEKGGDARLAVLQLVGGVTDGFGLPLTLAAVGALLVLAWRREPLVLLAGALCGPAIVTLTAYLAGHPTKARYPLLLAPAFALAIALATRERRLAQLGALALAVMQPLEVPDPLPVLREATRDRRAVAVRTPALARLRSAYRGGRVLASMGSTAPVLFEARLPLREIVHEGNGTFWEYATVDPTRYVSWVLVADNDVLDQVRTYRRAFPEGFRPVWKGASLTLYAREPVVPFDDSVAAPPSPPR